LVGLCALLVIGGVIGILAFRAGRHTVHAVTVLSGSAYSNGQDEATIHVGGWYYGVSQSVIWIGSDGTIHDGSWPMCLPRGTSEVTFGSVDTTRPTGQRTVVWVRC
jgi:hypothetical protein